MTEQSTTDVPRQDGQIKTGKFNVVKSPAQNIHLFRKINKQENPFKVIKMVQSNLNASQFFVVVKNLPKPVQTLEESSSKPQVKKQSWNFFSVSNDNKQEQPSSPKGPVAEPARIREPLDEFSCHCLEITAPPREFDLSGLGAGNNILN